MISLRRMVITVCWLSSLWLTWPQTSWCSHQVRRQKYYPSIGETNDEPHSFLTQRLISCCSLSQSVFSGDLSELPLVLLRLCFSHFCYIDQSDSQVVAHIFWAPTLGDVSSGLSHHFTTETPQSSPCFASWNLLLHYHRYMHTNNKHVCAHIFLAFMYTIIQKFGVSKIFWKKSLMFTKTALFDQKYSKNCNIVKCYYNYFYSCFLL